jgi:hemerythrin-like domain-containing protein
MLRDKNLIPLSRQHQHVLALCVRIDRGIQVGEADLAAWQSEIQLIYEQEVGVHFTIEEKELFPAAMKFPQLHSLVHELLREHGLLREYFMEAATGTMNVVRLKAFGELLSAHIRKEERHLFEKMQELMSMEELAAIGAALERELANAPSACMLPTAAAQLKGKTSRRS